MANPASLFNPGEDFGSHDWQLAAFEPCVELERLVRINLIDDVLAVPDVQGYGAVDISYGGQHQLTSISSHLFTKEVVPICI